MFHAKQGELVRREASCRVFASGDDIAFDAVCRHARDLFAVPVAQVILHDEGGRPPAEAHAPRERSRVPEKLHAELEPGLGRERDIRFKASVPLMLEPGLCAGSLSVMDVKPRRLSRQQVGQLRDLAEIVVAQLRLRRAFRSCEDELAVRAESERVTRSQARDLRERAFALREANRLLVMAEEIAQVGHFRYAVPQIVRTWSEQVYRIFGLDPADPPPDLALPDNGYHPEDRERVRRTVEAAILGRIDLDYEARVVRPSGEIRHVVVRGTYVQGDAGQASMLAGVVIDATERAERERALRTSEARYRALADALPQIVWVMAPDTGEMTYCNAQFSTYHGSIGTTAAARLAHNHPDDAERMRPAWTAYAAGDPFATEVRLRRYDGVYRWHKLMMIPVEREGVVIEWLGTALDIDDIVSARNMLEDTTELLRLAQDSAGAGVWDYEIGTGLVHQSPDSARMYGLAVAREAGPDARIAVPVSILNARVHPDDLAHVRAEGEKAVATRETYNTEFRVVRPPDEGGGYRWIQAFGRIVFADDGRPLRIVGLHLDVTDRKEAEAALRDSEARLQVSEERLALALDSGSDGLWDWDLGSDALWFSDRWHRMLGYEAGDLEPHRGTWQRLLHPEDAGRAMAAMRAHLDGCTASYECEYRLIRKDGTPIWVLSRGKVVERDAAGLAKRVVGTQIDITRRKLAERQVAHMAAHDALTGLPNRLLFRERLGDLIARAEPHDGAFAVLACDLDRFKSINDTLGHPAGDALLRAVAERLRSVVPADAMVARLGGDEFAVILDRVNDPHGARATAERIISAVQRPVDLDGHAASVGVSIGILLGADGTVDADTLFKNADIALYRAKATGRNTYRFYEAGMDAAVAARNALETELRDAVRRGEFALHYQPIVNLAGDAVAGFEALLRWRHPRRGLVSPAEFIPLAEETGLIVQVGAWALREACREATGWPGRLRVAVNVSAIQFQQAGFELGVAAALATSGLAADRLELEITESVLMQDSETALACLHRLRALGVRIALDDFGTGYSSLSYLRRFPFDKIKIDRCFIRDIDDPAAAAIVRAVVGIGASLGASVTAEGVETQDQLDRVIQEGCTDVQGYFVSVPLPAEDARRLLDQRSARPRTYRSGALEGRRHVSG